MQFSTDRVILIKSLVGITRLVVLCEEKLNMQVWRNWNRARPLPVEEEGRAQGCAVVDFVRAKASKQNREPQTGRRVAAAKTICIWCDIAGVFKIKYMRIWRNWQTRTVQVRMRAISCRFDSCYPHHKNNSTLLGLFFLYQTGVEP